MMNFNLRKECLHYLKKEMPDVGVRKLKMGIVWRQLFLHRFEIPYLEVFVTTYCNLKCKNCSNLIPSMANKHHVELTEIKKSVDTLLSKIDCLYRVKIHGGEAFLHPQLCDIIDYFDGQSKIKSIRITTNGTLIPSDDVLKRIANSKVVVQISDYAFCKNNATKLIDTLKKFKIRYVYLKDQEWVDMGDCLRRETSRYNECTIKRCTSLYKDKIYVCSRAAIMAYNGNIEDEGININLRKKELRKRVLELYKGKWSEACLHCDGDTHFANVVRAGEQYR